jgi:hypothetical protein
MKNYLITQCTNPGPISDPDFPEHGDTIVDCLTRHLAPSLRCSNCNAKREAAYKQEVDTFAAKMLRELMANDHKGDFLDWHPHWTSAMDEIRLHVKRLHEKLNEGAGMFNDEDRERVTELCADIANFVMKLEHEDGENSGEKPAALSSTKHEER